MRNKLAVLGLLAAAVVFAVAAVSAPMHGAMSMHRGMGIGVVIDGQPQHFAALPMMMSGRVMVPMREILEVLGGKVMWNGSDRTVTARRDDREVVLGVGKPEGMMNGKRMMLDAAPRMYHNRVFVPLRFVSEAMGAKVRWAAATRKMPPQAHGC